MSDFDDDSNGFGSNGFQMMGMMNALKTGDVHTDMVIAMCVPFVLKVLFGWVGKLEDLLDWEVWAEWWKGNVTDEHERFISHSTTRDRWGDVRNNDEDTQNSVLIKAIKMYLDQVLKLDLKTAYIDLTGMEEKGSHSGYDGYDSDDSDDDGYGSRKTLVGTLSRYKIINRMPNNKWHELGEFGAPACLVKVCIEHQTQTENDNSKENKNDPPSQVENTTYHFTSKGKGAIDAFIKTAYDWYLGELRKLEDNSRYYYEMKLPEFKIGRNDTDDSSGSTTYKRYRLSEEKTFDSLFFREKQSLLGLIDHFSAKSGKYSIKGYPHKLGILLHGPPGTGKTSLIKAMAEYTGRSIVNVPLSRVSTNSELMSIFFDRKYSIEGSYVPVKLGFKDVIFVMEDVDAASKIVKRRDGKKAEEVAPQERIELPVPKSPWRLFLESSEDDCKTLVEKLIETSDRLKKEAEVLRPQVLKSIAQRLTTQPALGLMGEATSEDPTLARVCEQAIESMNQQKEQQSKLSEVLASHAREITALLESGTKVDEAFENELLGEAMSVAATVSPCLTSVTATSASSSFSETDIPELDEVGGGLKLPDFDLLSEDGLDAGKVGKKSKGAGAGGFGPSLFRNPDALSLSGLLNVLDGVVDTPGRIVIMTTNHPEMLDPALIRPGRVDKKLMLGYMNAHDVVLMLEHYFQQKLTSEEAERVHDIVEGPSSNMDGDRVVGCGTSSNKYRLNLTPAQVEQLSAENDSLEDMFATLQGMADEIRPKSLVSTRSYTLLKQ